MEPSEAEQILEDKMIYHHSDYCPRCGHGWDCRSYYECPECLETYYGGSGAYLQHKETCSFNAIEKIASGE